MISIRRFDIYGPSSDSETGDLVNYDEHLCIVNELYDRLDTARTAYNSMVDIRDRLQKDLEAANETIN